MPINKNIDKAVIHRYLYLVHVKCLMEEDEHFYPLSEEDNINLGRIYDELDIIWYQTVIKDPVSIEGVFLENLYIDYSNSLINYILLNGPDFDLDKLEQLMLIT